MKITKKLNLILISSLLFIFNLAKVVFADGSSTAIDVIENSDLYVTPMENSDPRQILANIINILLGFLTIIYFIVALFIGVKSFIKKAKQENKIEINFIKKKIKKYLLFTSVIILILVVLHILYSIFQLDFIYNMFFFTLTVTILITTLLFPITLWLSIHLILKKLKRTKKTNITLGKLSLIYFFSIAIIIFIFYPLSNFILDILYQTTY